MATISCISTPLFLQQPLDTTGRLELASGLIDQAAIEKPDLICLPEHFAQSDISLAQRSEVQESLDGQIVTAMAKKAKQHHCYIICPALIRENSQLYNMAVLIDRKGKLAGIYRKCMPTAYEIASGVRPGDTPEVFQTDFGVIGMLLCFDLNFIELGRTLCKKGARLICFSSMWEAALQLRFWAFELRCYFASAVFAGRTSRIINPLGRVIAKSADYEPVITRTFCLDYACCHIDGNMDKIHALKAKYPNDANVQVATTEAHILFSPNDEAALTSAELIKEFDIELLEDYYARSRVTRNNALNLE